MGREAVRRDAEQDAVPLLELFRAAGQGDELAGADGREVGRMGEKQDPVSAQGAHDEFAMRGPGAEIRSPVANAQKRKGIQREWIRS